jgi:hypothetical protein
MFRTLRTKLLIGLTPLLAIIVGLGLWAIVMFSRLGNKIDVILKENYASVLAAEGMKEAWSASTRRCCSPSAARNRRGGTNSPNTGRCSNGT